MRQELFYLGVTHASVPLSLREALRPDARKQAAILDQLGGLAEGRMVLATCDRFEVYASAVSAATGAWIERVGAWFQLPPAQLARRARVLSGEDAARHLLRVSAGLDSRIVGEPHILAQVRDAHRQALDAGALDARLAALGRTAIRTGRRLRAETAINGANRSIVTVAVEHLKHALGRLEERRVLVVGGGRIAEELLAVLRPMGPAGVGVCARNAGRMALLAQRHGAQAIEWSDLTEALRWVDAVVVCTSAPGYVIDGACLGAACADKGEPLSVVDLAVPRNVDPAVGRLPGVALTHMDDLVARFGPAADDGVPAAEAIVREELGQFRAWCRQRVVAGDVAAMYRAARERYGDSVPLGVRRSLHKRVMRMKREVAA